MEGAAFNWNLLFSGGSFLAPELSLECQAFIRISYGVLMLGFLLWNLPQWKRFFLTEKFGGYAEDSNFTTPIQNPIGTSIIAIVWSASCIGLVSGFFPMAAALTNLLLCHYFFVQMRWRGIVRGLGAPGFMSYWLGMAVFLLELGSAISPASRTLALLVAQIDFAFIMFSAGFYKFTAGYAKNEGMEYGMANPEWGYWWKLYKNVAPGNFVFKLLDQLAWSTEVVAAVLMIIPQTRFIGAMLILLSFIFIRTQIRLGLLCEKVILCCFLFFHPASIANQWLNKLLPANQAASTAMMPNAEAASALFNGLLWAYLILLPLAHAGLFYNFYGKKPLIAPLQLALEKYTNWFGLIIWRVFSVDHTNFFILVYQRNRETGARKLISNYGWQGGFRFNHVAESITVTSLFTTLKYYASNQALFKERLFRYAKTLSCPDDCVLEFEYMSIKKGELSFEFIPVAVYELDLLQDDLKETILDDSVSVKAVHKTSPAHEGGRPGSYVPLGN